MFTAATAALKAGKLLDAHVMFHQVVSGSTTDTPGRRQRARLLLARTLVRLGIHAGALSHLQHILQGPALSRQRIPAIVLLVKVGRTLPSAHRAVPKKLNVNVPGLRPVRDELLLIMARRALRQGQFAFAISYARRVSQSSKQFQPARLVHWEALWRSRKLAKASKVLQSGFLKGSQHEARANLELARMFWRSKDIPRARRHFRGAIAVAKKGSRLHATAAFEQSLMRLHQRGKLSQLRQLRPVDQRWLVHATFCTLGPQRDAFLPYRDPKRSPAADLNKLLRRFPDNVDLLAYATRKPTKTNKPADMAEMLLAHILRDPATRRGLALHRELAKELAALPTKNGPWRTTAAAAEVLQELSLQHSLAQADAGRIIRQRIRTTVRAIAQLSKAVGRRGSRIGVGVKPGRGFHASTVGCPQ